MTASGGAVPDWVAAVGRRIRALRRDRGWTVQQLADRADVSRRMLTQIELGQANPSLTTVDRIAVALGTDFPGLALASTPDAATVDLVDIVDPARVWEDPDGSEAVLLGVTTASPRSELWRWTLAAGRTYESGADADGTEAVVHVMSGTLTIDDADHVVAVPAGETAVFRTGGAYRYVNDTDAEVRFVRLFRSL
jgi:transcriptional regulator with XRE-family HTH domain